MDILISGASGLIGSALQPFLTSRGHRIRRLVRHPPKSGSRDIFWNPPFQGPTVASLEGVEAIIHLAGESIASGRWTESRKRKILESRVRSTELLVSAVSDMQKSPSVFISGSAIGFYGNRGATWLDEKSAAGPGFLPEVCLQWEAAAKPVESKGVRLVHLRTGIVLSLKGGALAKMILPFKLGLGGRLGSGDQYMSWVSVEDIVHSILFALETPSVSGAMNAVAPEPVTNAEFTRTLGRLLHRPSFCAVPAVALQMALGEMAEELLLSSQRVRPGQLLSKGFSFQHPTLESALGAIFSSK